MSFSIDGNVLLYASSGRSPHHGPAREFLDRCRRDRTAWYLTWPTLVGYLRMATHAAILDPPLAPAEAMANVSALVALPHVRTVSEGDGFWEVYCEVTAGAPPRGKAVPDAHLAALLRLHGVRTLYTNDRDFLRFDFLDVRNPVG